MERARGAIMLDYAQVERNWKAAERMDLEQTDEESRFHNFKWKAQGMKNKIRFPGGHTQTERSGEGAVTLDCVYLESIGRQSIGLIKEKFPHTNNTTTNNHNKETTFLEDCIVYPKTPFVSAEMKQILHL